MAEREVVVDHSTRYQNGCARICWSLAKMASNAGRYEFWLYRQIRKRFQSGEFHLNDSLRHRHLSDELIPEGEQATVCWLK
jgi:hypothetical protein